MHAIRAPAGKRPQRSFGGTRVLQTRPRGFQKARKEGFGPEVGAGGYVGLLSVSLSDICTASYSVSTVSGVLVSVDSFVINQT